jgi:hypothetical protein
MLKRNMKTGISQDGNMCRWKYRDWNTCTVSIQDCQDNLRNKTDDSEID